MSLKEQPCVSAKPSGATFFSIEAETYLHLYYILFQSQIKSKYSSIIFLRETSTLIQQMAKIPLSWDLVYLI